MHQWNLIKSNSLQLTSEPFSNFRWQFNCQNSTTAVSQYHRLQWQLINAKLTVSMLSVHARLNRHPIPHDRLTLDVGLVMEVRLSRYLVLLSTNSKTWARFLSPILSQVTWQVTWPRPRSQVTCGVFCLCSLKWLHKSLGPKSLGLFWNAPYCFHSDALLTSPCISVNTIVTSHVNTIVTSLNAASSQPTMPTMLSQPMASHC